MKDPVDLNNNHTLVCLKNFDAILKIDVIMSGTGTDMAPFVRCLPQGYLQRSGMIDSMVHPRTPTFRYCRFFYTPVKYSMDPRRSREERPTLARRALLS